MAWRRIGDKPLSEPMLPDSLTHVCGIRGRGLRWVNGFSRLVEIGGFSLIAGVLESIVWLLMTWGYVSPGIGWHEFRNMILFVKSYGHNEFRCYKEVLPCLLRTWQCRVTRASAGLILRNKIWIVKSTSDGIVQSCRGHFVFVISHWLGACIKWSLVTNNIHASSERFACMVKKYWSDWIV